MPLVAAKCTQCGSDLKVDNTLEAAICSYCNTAFVVENAINNYNTYQQSTYNINHANIQMNDVKSIENRIRSAEVFLTTFKEYEKARKLFDEIAQDAPDDYRTWWGIVRADTREFSNYADYKSLSIDGATDKIKEYEHYYTKTITVAPSEPAAKIANTWREYHEKADFTIQVVRKLAELKSQRKQLSYEIEQLKFKVKEKEDEKAFDVKMVSAIFAIVVGIIIITTGRLIVLGLIIIAGGGIYVTDALHSFSMSKKYIKKNREKISTKRKRLNAIDIKIHELEKVLK